MERRPDLAEGLVRARRVVRVAVAAALVAIGCGGDPESRPAASASTQGAARGVPEVLPVTGAELVERIREGRAPATLVNVWATWCMPCREEMPDLLELREKVAERGIAVLLVSADFEAETASAYLAEMGVDFASYIRTGKDHELIEALSPEWGGALPATFVFDREGTLRTFWQGKASYERFLSEVDAVAGDGDGRIERTGGVESRPKEERS